MRISDGLQRVSPVSHHGIPLSWTNLALRYKKVTVMLRGREGHNAAAVNGLWYYWRVACLIAAPGSSTYEHLNMHCLLFAVSAVLLSR